MGVAWSIDQTLLVSAVPTVVAALAVGGIGRIQARRVQPPHASEREFAVEHNPSIPSDKKA